MTGVEIGSERCSTDKHDPQANRQIPLECGVSAELIYLDGAYCGTNPNRSGLDQALAAVRAGDAWSCRYSPVPRPKSAVSACESAP